MQDAERQDVSVIATEDVISCPKKMEGLDVTGGVGVLGDGGGESSLESTSPAERQDKLCHSH